MKALIQRVTQSSVTVDGNLVSSIGKGLCVLVGISHKDAPKDAAYIVRKILNLRLFDDDNEKRWAKNVMEKQYEVLCVSQFTLEMVLKGNKPDFHNAMAGELSEDFYNRFLQEMRETYSPEKIKDGTFGAYMQVHIQNDGPITIPIESPANLPDPKVRKPQNYTKNQRAASKQQDATKGTEASTDSPDNQGACGES